jgi:hypothetical protein
MLDRTGEQWAERLRVEGDKRTLARIIARLREEANTLTARFLHSGAYELNRMADTLEREGAK